MFLGTDILTLLTHFEKLPAPYAQAITELLAGIEDLGTGTDFIL